MMSLKKIDYLFGFIRIYRELYIESIGFDCRRFTRIFVCYQSAESDRLLGDVIGGGAAVVLLSGGLGHIPFCCK